MIDYTTIVQYCRLRNVVIAYISSTMRFLVIDDEKGKNRLTNKERDQAPGGLGIAGLSVILLLGFIYACSILDKML